MEDVEVGVDEQRHPAVLERVPLRQPALVQGATSSACGSTRRDACLPPSASKPAQPACAAGLDAGGFCCGPLSLGRAASMALRWLCISSSQIVMGLAMYQVE
jgi:hypothetical protein